MTDAVDRLQLARTVGVGPKTYRQLMHRFTTAAAALVALPELSRQAGRPLKPAPRAQAVAELDRLQRLGGRMLFVGQPGYPALLALMEDAPPALALLGQPAALTGRAVALVGSRNASANGMRLAEMLAEALAGQGIAVVSGMARGIDAASHQGALRSGVTVASVAGGLDCPYPPEHADLQARIAEAGGVVAEAPLGTAPQARHFPRRNRIVAGLSLGVVVVEAALRSGSLITARIAQEEGRELFAVPGSPLDPRCRGTNALLRQGAHLTETVDDVLANLPPHPHAQGLGRDPLFAHGRETPPALEEPQIALEAGPGALASVVALLGPAPSLVDDLIRRCQFSAPEVRAALLDLELAGRIEALHGGRVALLGAVPD